LFKAQFGLQTVEVKYKDSAAGVNDLVGGNIVFTHIDPAGSVGFIKEGKIRPLATTSAEKLAALPDIPSAAEAGITNTNIIAWWSVHTPKGTPKPILDKLELWFNKIAVDDDTKKFLQVGGSDPFPGNSAMLKELLLKDIKAWAEYVKIAKIEPIS
jgi:tripartite-type tricarboxylate transporter receptor subunit TctC